MPTIPDPSYSLRLSNGTLSTGYGSLAAAQYDARRYPGSVVLGHDGNPLPSESIVPEDELVITLTSDGGDFEAGDAGDANEPPIQMTDAEYEAALAALDAEEAKKGTKKKP